MQKLRTFYYLNTFAIWLNIKYKLRLKSWLCVFKIFATKPEFDLWEPLRG